MTNTTRPTGGHELTKVEYAEASTRDLADELCAGSTHARDEDAGEFHCQECYDIACTVHDSPWLARLLAARGADAAVTDGGLRAAVEAIRDDLVQHSAILTVNRARVVGQLTAVLDAAPAPTVDRADRERRNPTIGSVEDHRPNACCDYHRHIADGCCHCEEADA